MPEYIQVHTEDEYKAASLLFKEYADWLNIDLSFQHFEEELERLPKMYGEPNGAIMLCKMGTAYTGCIAIRKIDTNTAELKRMYVKPSFQQKGIGNELLQHVLELAKKYHYKKIKLDTLSNMEPAINLYKKNGFYEIPPYYFNPEPTALFFEKIL